jgi:hypothetical protein
MYFTSHLRTVIVSLLFNNALDNNKSGADIYIVYDTCDMMAKMDNFLFGSLSIGQGYYYDNFLSKTYSRA